MGVEKGPLPRGPERRPLRTPSRVGGPGPPQPGPWFTSLGLVPAGPQVGLAPGLADGGAAPPLPPTVPPGLWLPVFAPHLRLRLVPLNTHQPAGRCQWETQAAGDLMSFSTMSSWNAPYTCSSLRIFTQLKKKTNHCSKNSILLRLIISTIFF